MLYKHAFIQYDHVPPEHLERDKQFHMRRCAQEIVEAVLRDYNFDTRKNEENKDIHRIELVVLKATKFYQGVESIEKILSAFRPDLAVEILHIIDQMNEPDNQISHDRESLQ